MHECRRIAYDDRQGHFVFVKIPNEYGRYARVPNLVTYAPCPACGSPVGVPCIGQYDRHVGSIHADRMVLAEKMRRAHGVSGEHLIREDILEHSGLWSWL